MNIQIARGRVNMEIYVYILDISYIQGRCKTVLMGCYNVYLNIDISKCSTGDWSYA